MRRGGGPDDEHGRKYSRAPLPRDRMPAYRFLCSLVHLCVLLSISGSLVVRLRDTRGRVRDHYVGNAGNNDMQRIHYGGAG